MAEITMTISRDALVVIMDALETAASEYEGIDPPFVDKCNILLKKFLEIRIAEAPTEA